MENSSHNADSSNFEGTADIPDLHATDITVNGISKRRDSIYYFEDGSIVLEVDIVPGSRSTRLFRVHRAFLERDSPKLKEQIKQLKDGEGATDEKPLRLEGVHSSQLSDLLWMFYNSTYNFNPSSASSQKWINILKTAYTLEMKIIRQIAIDALSKHELDPSQKLELCRQYSIDKIWAVDAFSKLVSRDQLLSVQDGNRLGMEMVLIIANAREKVAATKKKQPIANTYCPSCGRYNQSGYGYCSCATTVTQANVEEIVKNAIKTFST